jgi:hypothetical protein
MGGLRGNSGIERDGSIQSSSKVDDIGELGQLSSTISTEIIGAGTTVLELKDLKVVMNENFDMTENYVDTIIPILEGREYTKTEPFRQTFPPTNARND